MPKMIPRSPTLARDLRTGVVLSRRWARGLLSRLDPPSLIVLLGFGGNTLAMWLADHPYAWLSAVIGIGLLVFTMDTARSVSTRRVTLRETNE